MTYAKLAGGVERVAAGLAERGFGPGDVFGIVSPNLPEFPLAFQGAIRAGGAVTTVNPLTGTEALAHQLSDSGARLLLTVSPMVEEALAAAKASGVEEVFVLGEGEGATPFAALLQSSGDAPALADLDPREALAALPYSSGTTGLPKGVMLSHRNLVANVAQFYPYDDGTADDVMIGIPPFFHVYGMTVIANAALRNGSTIVTMPRFDLEQFLTLIEKHRVTKAFVVPPILVALAKHPMVDDYDLSSLVRAPSGAAPLGSDLARAVEERIGCQVVQGYGMTETSPFTHFVPAERAAHWTKHGSVGPVLPGVEAKIVNIETGDEVGPGERGELCMRGANVMKGYLNNEQATREMIDGDRWLHTVDVATVDEDGDFYIVDRVKELIKYKGYQVPPAELEALLLRHDDIADAAVIPVPDEEAGEIPKAYVVVAEGASLSEEAVIRFTAEHVAPYKKLRAVAFIEEIPKSASGKILRRELVAREQE